MTKRHQFKGFDDPVEIFRAGTHTDSQGREGSWTEADLDEMVRNHNESTAAPAVIGHPETNDPAYGWVERLERKGKSLFAHFKDVVPQFAEAVEKGRYRKRSVSVGKSPDGWRLLHVGWLGAKAPALDLAPMNYSTPDDVRETFEFEADWHTPGIIARAMRRLREFLIEQYGSEAADRVMPDHDIEFLDEHADDLRNRERERASSEADASPAFASFAKHTGENAVKNFSQDDLDKARADAKAEAAREFEQQQQTLRQELDQARADRHKSEFSAELDKLQAEGKLTPAQAEGALEFMQALASQPISIEFSSSDGKSTNKTDPLAWFRNFVQHLPKQVEIGKRDEEGAQEMGTRSQFNAPHGTVVDSDRLSLHERAVQYAKTNKVPYIDAVMAVEQES